MITRTRTLTATHILALALTVITQPSNAEICSPDLCISGASRSALLAYDTTSSKSYIPGSYSYLKQNPSDFTPSDSTTTITTTNLTIVNSSPGLTFAPPVLSLLFPGKNYDGSPIRADTFNATTTTTSPTTSSLAIPENGPSGALLNWESAYLPEGWYGLVSPGEAIWGAIPDRRQIVLRQGQVDRLVKVAYSKCEPPCGSNGICTPASSNTTGTGSIGQCACKAGWTGPTCSSCASGLYGSSCKPCEANCTICDDGLAGSGTCLGTATNSSKLCDCLHGTCTFTGDCVCSAGWKTDDTKSASAGARKCNSCAEGFYVTGEGDCRVCPLGCLNCEVADVSTGNGTNATAPAPKCTTCFPGLVLSSASPPSCVPPQTCLAHQYWDGATSSCQSCSPACTTCTGPTPGECLACASPRANLNGSCVGYDPTTGVCDSALSGFEGVFVLDNGKARCEACPTKCASCTVPSFSPSALYSSLICSACQDGYLLESGRCVKQCSEGYFLPQGAGRNGTCQRCDKSCLSCITTSTTCTRCPAPAPSPSPSPSGTSPPTFAHQGICTPTCPPNTIPSNGTRQPCSPNCATCSAPLSDSSCLSCPVDRPILRDDGRCVEYCPRGTFFDPSASSSVSTTATPNPTPSNSTSNFNPAVGGADTSDKCLACDKSCLSCLGSSTTCTSCPETYLLVSGKCIPTRPVTSATTSNLTGINATNTTSTTACHWATGLGTCLESLRTPDQSATSLQDSPQPDQGKEKKKYLGLVAIPLIILFLALMAFLYIRKKRRETRAATREFGDALDDRDVREKMMRLRLERVLGMDRVSARIRAATEQAEGTVPAASGNQLGLGAEMGTGSRGKGRLRELFLSSRKFSAATITTTTTTKDKDKAIPMGDIESNHGGKAYGQSENRGADELVPPPPYFPPASYHHGNGHDGTRDHGGSRSQFQPDAKDSHHYIYSPRLDVASNSDATRARHGSRESVDTLDTLDLVVATDASTKYLDLGDKPYLPSFPKTGTGNNDENDTSSIAVGNARTTEATLFEPSARTIVGGSGLRPPPLRSITSTGSVRPRVHSEREIQRSSGLAHIRRDSVESPYLGTGAGQGINHSIPISENGIGNDFLDLPSSPFGIHRDAQFLVSDTFVTGQVVRSSSPRLESAHGASGQELEDVWPAFRSGQRRYGDGGMI